MAKSFTVTGRVVKLKSFVLTLGGVASSLKTRWTVTMFVGGKFVGESYVRVVSVGTATGSTTTTGTTLWPLTKSWIELVLSFVLPSTMVITIFASSGTSVAPFKGLVDLTNGRFTVPQVTESRGR